MGLAEAVGAGLGLILIALLSGLVRGQQLGMLSDGV